MVRVVVVINSQQPPQNRLIIVMGDDGLRVSYIWFASKEERMQFLRNVPEFIEIEQNFDKLRRQWARSFYSLSNPVGRFFVKYPGLQKLIGTKLLLFSAC